jgi:hypothetical protein
MNQSANMHFIWEYVADVLILLYGSTFLSLKGEFLNNKLDPITIVAKDDESLLN